MNIPRENSSSRSNRSIDRSLLRSLDEAHLTPRRQYLRDISTWFSDAVWDTPLWTLRNLAYQLHISSEEAVLEVLQTCQHLRESPGLYQLVEDDGRLSTRARGNSVL